MPLLWLALTTGHAAEIASAPAGAVETGAPAYELLTTESLGLDTAPTDFRELPDGRILLVAGLQLALGDGVRWQVYEQGGDAERVPVTSAGVDLDGSIYVAMPDGVAKVEFGEDGRWRPRLVAPWSIPGQQNKLMLPQAMMQEAGGEWLWHSLTGAILSWRPGRTMELRGFSNTIETAFEFDGNFYVSERANGTLARLQSGESEQIKSEGSLSAITSSLALGPGRLLVGTYGRGLQLFDGRAVHGFAADELFSSGERVNDLCRTESGFLAAAIDGYGIVFFTEDGRTVEVLDRSSDSRFARIRRLRNGHGGVVWALFDAGIARVQFPARVSNFETQFGNGLTTAHPYRLGNTLWMLADGRLYRGAYDHAGRLTHLDLDSP
ncbi:MAG TPA: hypothetical protein VKB34_18750, partial [Povalibacter sp.]|nr:hypothetical protein [Povalibacter sp.]